MKKALTEAVYDDVLAEVAANPSDAGETIRGTGGVKKMRVKAHESKGKSGGGRMVYFYYRVCNQIYILDFFLKSEKSNLSQKEKNQMKTFVENLKGLRK